jgi:hypothetical protein
MEFRFIDNKTRLDRRTQRVIRSHAMKGKNLGKVLPARGHKNRQGEQGIIIHPGRIEENARPLSIEAIGPVSDAAEAHTTQSLLNPFCGTEFSFIAFPIEVTPLVRYLFNECTRPVGFIYVYMERNPLTTLELSPLFSPGAA